MAHDYAQFVEGDIETVNWDDPKVFPDHGDLKIAWFTGKCTDNKVLWFAHNDRQRGDEGYGVGVVQFLKGEMTEAMSCRRRLSEMVLFFLLF